MDPILDILDSRILSCGHTPSPHGAHSTGTAWTHDGKEICWKCMDERTRRHMASGRPVQAYLSSDGKTITTWSGGKLADVTWSAVRKVGFRKAKRTYWKATDATGKRWHGCGSGPNMSTVMRPNK